MSVSPCLCVSVSPCLCVSLSLYLSCLRCDSRRYRGASARREFKHASAPTKRSGGPRRTHPLDTSGWTPHHFGAGDKQAEARSRTLIPAPPPSGQFPTWPPVSLDRGPRGASAAGPHIPMVGNHGGIFLPLRPRRAWVTIGRLPACIPGTPESHQRQQVPAVPCFNTVAGLILA